MLSAKLKVAEEGVISGRGLIAEHPIKKAEMVWQPDPAYPLVDFVGLKKLRDSGNGDYYSQVDNDCYARNSPDAWRFNHSCDPNCKLVNRQTIALRDIAVGEELTYDYGLTEVDLWYRFWCDCGGPKCRLLITNLDYLHPAIRQTGQHCLTQHALEKAAGASAGEVLRLRLLRWTLLPQRRLMPRLSVPSRIQRFVYNAIYR